VSPELHAELAPAHDRPKLLAKTDRFPRDAASSPSPIMPGCRRETGSSYMTAPDSPPMILISPRAETPCGYAGAALGAP